MLVQNWMKQPYSKKKVGEGNASTVLFVGIEPLFNFESDFYKTIKQKYEQNPEDPSFGLYSQTFP